MRAYIFWRSMSPLLHLQMGHVGWGFAMGNGQFCCGATENVKGSPQVWAPANADAWYKIVNSEQEMLAEMAQSHFVSGNQYHSYKFVDLRNGNGAAALDRAKKNMTAGFTVAGNNCLDQATNVIAAFGVPWQDALGNPNWGMPWRETNSQPTGWFQAWDANGPINLR